MRCLPAKTCRPYSLLCAVKIVKQYGPSKMGGDGHGHGEKFKIPDWKQYKVDGIKELEWTRQSLADKGLRDPWLRNEVWRYKYWPGFGRNAMTNVFRGFKYALAAMVVTVAIDQAFGISKSKHHHAGHHEDHHGEHH